MKCLIKNCNNLFNDVEFRGTICLPCARSATTGQWQGLTDEEKAKLLRSPMPLIAVIEEVELKLKARNYDRMEEKTSE